MTSPRSYDGVGYPSPSFSSGTPIYDSLVAERGVPQIAPINVPAALPPALSSTYGSGYDTPGFGAQGFGTSGFGSPGFGSPASNLPALPPARLALGPGPSSGPATTYIPAQQATYAAAPQPPIPGYGGGQQPYVPPQRPQPPAPGFQQYQQAGQSFGGQNNFAGAPQGFNGQSFGGQGFGAQGGGNGQQFGAQSFNGPAPQSFPDQSFGGQQFRPMAPTPIRPVQPQRPAQQYGEQPQYPQQTGYQGNAY